MRIETIPEKKIKVYKLAELPEDIQAKIIQREAEPVTDYPWWDGDYTISRKCLDKLAASAKLSPETRRAIKKEAGDAILTWQPLNFDLDYRSYLQMGSPRVNGQRGDTGPEITDNGRFLELLGISRKVQDQADISFSFDNSRENNTAIEFEVEPRYKPGGSREDDAKAEAAVDGKIMEAIIEIATTAWEMIAEDGLRQLKDQYEYLQSEEAIRENIEANGCEFTEDGEMF